MSIPVNGRIEQAIPLQGGGVAAIVRPPAGPSSARLYNPDGSLRATLSNPLAGSAGFEFYYFIYFGDQLRVVLAGATSDFQSIVDEATGEISPPTEAR